ncbi:GNAT family N-acetyltransferase [Pandoraea eparura]|jgi:GNAT superfamily N-acetyltransferase|uniref:GNAT family N-acetyltransferase n=1 Tax=Pandoraea eparura TaxID=2508291 RepID=A0A5E4RQ01_9BURK|nr:GNAT family N-acetyltransferase [Pandoraea eparura]VVD64534.1 GNAT family N-acetyltransferase [Pandoraea eparura]
MNDLSHGHPTPPADAIVDISSDPARLDIGFIHHALSTQTHWAKDIPRVTLMRAIAHSLCFGAYATHVEGGAARQVGFARVITDRATFAYLADVFVDPSMRGLGIGKRLCESVLAHPALQGLRRFLLATTDAAGLYARYGFEPLDPVNKMMQIHRPDIYTGPQDAP